MAITYTPELLSKLLSAPQERITPWVEAFNTTLPKFSINTSKRVAAFCAQIAVESNHLANLEENLHYSAARLVEVFPIHFTTSQATIYAVKGPEAIANRIYANRMGNGPEASGDGWKYRGRGCIQITGKSNYHAASTATQDYTVNPDLVKEPEGALSTALWYWNSRNLNSLADAMEFSKITYRINGGLIGNDTRLALWRANLLILEA